MSISGRSGLADWSTFLGHMCACASVYACVCVYAHAFKRARRSEPPNVGQDHLHTHVFRIDPLDASVRVRACVQAENVHPSARGGATGEIPLAVPVARAVVHSGRILVALRSCPSACRQPCNVKIAVHGLCGHGQHG